MSEATDPTRHLAGIDPHPLLEEEQVRAIRFFEGLDEAGWDVPTACPGWRRREMAAHLASSEDYCRSTLDGTRATFLAEGVAAGAHDLDSFNDWGVRRYAAGPPAAAVADLRDKSAANRRGLRDRGDGDIDSMVGPYSARLQAFHLAFEAAIHNDDMDVPIPESEVTARDAWRAATARFMVEESAHPVDLEVVDGGTRVRARGTGESAVLADADLVRGISGRLGDRAALYPVSVTEALAHPG